MRDAVSEFNTQNRERIVTGAKLRLSFCEHLAKARSQGPAETTSYWVRDDNIIIDDHEHAHPPSLNLVHQQTGVGLPIPGQYIAGNKKGRKSWNSGLPTHFFLTAILFV